MQKEKVINFLNKLYSHFLEDEVPALGAQLTYYLLLAFFPFLIFLLTLLAYTPVTSEVFINDLAWILPGNAYSIVRDILYETRAVRSDGLLSFGMVVALWAASNGMNAVIHGINKAYGEDETRSFWRIRGISVLSTILLALVFLFSLAMLVFGRVLGELFFSSLGFTGAFLELWAFLRHIIPLGITMLVFILIYKYTPNRRLSFKQVLPGSIFTTFSLILISIGFSYYVNSFANYTIMYGSLGGIIVLLLWLYMSSIVILLGGAINAILAD